MQVYPIHCHLKINEVGNTCPFTTGRQNPSCSYSVKKWFTPYLCHSLDTLVIAIASFSLLSLRSPHVKQSFQKVSSHVRFIVPKVKPAYTTIPVNDIKDPILYRAVLKANIILIFLPILVNLVKHHRCEGGGTAHGTLHCYILDIDLNILLKNRNIGTYNQFMVWQETKFLQ